MKKCLSVFFLLCLISISASASDSCKKPDEYTVDKRCYVTHKQKQEKPFNAVVQLGIFKGNSCSGTIVRQCEDLYLYTAKHCVVQEDKNQKDKDYMEKITAMTAKNGYVGSKKLDISETEDFAIYKVNRKNLSFVGVGSELLPGQELKVVGHGSLKIMSDDEIEKFQKKYISYLLNKYNIKAFDNKTKSEYGFVYDGVGFNGTLTDYEKVQDFLKYLIEYENPYYNDIFGDTAFMKVSNCKYSVSGNLQGCQGYGGDSGAGLFDNNGDIVGVVFEGYKIIGGKRHAKISGFVNVQNKK